MWGRGFPSAVPSSGSGNGGRHRETVEIPDVCVRVSSKFADNPLLLRDPVFGLVPAQTLLWDTRLDDR